MTFIHDLPRWPVFTWDRDAVATRLGETHLHRGRLLGRVEAMGFEVQTEAGLTGLMQEAITSSAIEGEDLQPEDVRSSIARRLGQEIAQPRRTCQRSEGVADIMVNATQRHADLVTKQRLLRWHEALLAPTAGAGQLTVGAWRDQDSDPMQVISGRVGRPRVHFEAPSANRIELEMQAFLSWLNAPSKEDAVLRAGIAHLWFLTVHPFDDGNGRIARALTELLLARSDHSTMRFYSMSSSILTKRSEYYEQLEAAQRGSLDITAWLKWFIECLHHAVTGANELLGGVLSRAAYWQRINTDPVNDRQRNVLNRLLGDFQGHLTTVKYAKLTKCSTDTALRDIHLLLKRNILIRNDAGGRSTSYRLGPIAGVVGA